MCIPFSCLANASRVGANTLTNMKRIPSFSSHDPCGQGEELTSMRLIRSCTWTPQKVELTKCHMWMADKLGIGYLTLFFWFLTELDLFRQPSHSWLIQLSLAAFSYEFSLPIIWSSDILVIPYLRPPWCVIFNLPLRMIYSLLIRKKREVTEGKRRSRRVSIPFMVDKLSWYEAEFKFGRSRKWRHLNWGQIVTWPRPAVCSICRYSLGKLAEYARETFYGSSQFSPAVDST